MKFGSFKKLAAVSAVALSAAMYAGVGYAFDSGDTVNDVLISGTVLNTINIDTTTLDFGTIAAVAKNADPATASLTTGSVLTDDANVTNSAQARLVADTTSTPAAAHITIIAFGDTQVFFDYGVADPDLQGGGAEKFILTALADNLDTPDTGVADGAGNAGGWTTLGGDNQGSAVTDGTGHLEFHIGGTIETQQGAGTYVYPTDNYAGQFELTVSY